MTEYSDLKSSCLHSIQRSQATRTLTWKATCTKNFQRWNNHHQNRAVANFNLRVGSREVVLLRKASRTLRVDSVCQSRKCTGSEAVSLFDVRLSRQRKKCILAHRGVSQPTRLLSLWNALTIFWIRSVIAAAQRLATSTSTTTLDARRQLVRVASRLHACLPALIHIVS